MYIVGPKGPGYQYFIPIQAGAGFGVKMDTYWAFKPGACTARQFGSWAQRTDNRAWQAPFSYYDWNRMLPLEERQQLVDWVNSSYRTRMIGG